MKVFIIDDCDWWAGENLESVKAAYMEWCGLGEDDVSEIRELTQKEMDEFLFHEDDETECSFATHLSDMIDSGEKFPCFFASTEY